MPVSQLILLRGSSNKEEAATVMHGCLAISETATVMCGPCALVDCNRRSNGDGLQMEMRVFRALETAVMMVVGGLQ